MNAQSSTDQPHHIRCVPDGSVFSGVPDSSVFSAVPPCRSEFPSETVHILTEHSDEVWYLAFSRDGSRLASGAKDGQVVIWDMQVSECRGSCLILCWSCIDSPIPCRASGPSGCTH